MREHKSTFAQPVKLAPVVEDPWDVSGPVPTASTRLGLLLAVLIASWAMLIGLAVAQPAPPPTDALDGKRKVTIVLSHEAELLAEDYLFLLEQLNQLTADYASYFSEMHTEQGQKCLANLTEINRLLRDTATYSGYVQMAEYFDNWQDRLMEHEEMLASGSDESKQERLYELDLLDEQISDIKKDVAEIKSEAYALREEIKRSYDRDGDLTDELEETLDDLKASETELKHLQRARLEQAKEYQSQHESRRIGRLSNGLRREITVLQEMFQESVVENLQNNRELALLIEARVKQVVAERLGNLSRLEYVIHRVELDEAPELAVELEVLEVEIPEVPAVPDVRVPWVNVVETEIYMPRPSGGANLLREMSDSVKVSSTKLPIIVVNPIGQLDINGWKHDRVVVTCEFEVTANSKRKAEKILEQLDLRIYERKQAVFVEIVAPELTDPQVTIGYSRVRINAPGINPLVVKSAAGRASIAGFENSAKISTTNCDLTIKRIRGTVDVVSNMGRVNLIDVTGPMGLSNSYQPLELTRCDGNIDIENTYSLVSLIDCRGKAEISNSGPTRVSDFTGMIDVENSNGLLELEQIDGDVTAFNKLQPLLISEVTGSATLRNTRGMVQVESISGELSVTNFFAPIMVRSAEGPIYLVNDKGSIDLALASALLGPSTILCQNGTVNLKLGSRPNLLLTIESVGGTIKSARPIDVVEDGVTRSARLELGEASQTLAITGANSTIMIK